MARTGYILRYVERAAGGEQSFGLYFQSAVRGELETTRDQAFAWFTESLDVASAMLIDLYLRLNVEFRIVAYAHP